jgi:hypothetical protein
MLDRCRYPFDCSTQSASLTTRSGFLLPFSSPLLTSSPTPSTSLSSSILTSSSTTPSSSSSCPTTHISDRFLLGGPTSVRGFTTNGLGPRDGSDSLGADLTYSLGLSLYGPLPIKPEWPLKLHAFANAGKLAPLGEDRTFSLCSAIRSASSARHLFVFLLPVLPMLLYCCSPLPIFPPSDSFSVPPRPIPSVSSLSSAQSLPPKPLSLHSSQPHHPCPSASVLSTTSPPSGSRQTLPSPSWPARASPSRRGSRSEWGWSSSEGSALEQEEEKQLSCGEIARQRIEALLSAWTDGLYQIILPPPDRYLYPEQRIVDRVAKGHQYVWGGGKRRQPFRLSILAGSAYVVWLPTKRSQGSLSHPCPPTSSQRTWTR